MITQSEVDKLEVGDILQDDDRTVILIIYKEQLGYNDIIFTMYQLVRISGEMEYVAYKIKNKPYFHRLIKLT